MKKHISQMDKSEVNYLMGSLKRKRKLVYSDHCLEKASERGIPLWIVEKAVKNGELIEYHRKSIFEHRVLIRGKQTSRGSNPCVVLDVMTKEVVTVYYNNANDNHPTIDLSKYTSKLDIIKTITLGKVFYK